MISDAQAREIVRNARFVPDRHRVFRHDAAFAWQRLRLSEPTVTALLDAGFPSGLHDDRRLFDQSDLVNASLALKLPSGRFAMMRRWIDALRVAAGSEPVRHRIDLTRADSRSDSGDGVEVAPQVRRHLSAGADAGAGGGSNTGTLAVEVRTSEPSRPLTGAALSDLVRIIRPLEFFVLPVELRYDLGFLRETNLADCQLATHYLVTEGRQRGLEIRSSFGLFLATPFSTTHTWPEVRHAGRWTGFDPHMLNSLARWQLADPDDWPALTPVDRVLVRLGDQPFPLMTRSGQTVAVSLPTKRSFKRTTEI